MQVSVAGVGQTPVGEHWGKGIRELAVEAVLAALQDAHIDQVDAVYVGNMASGTLADQEMLGALIADALGMHGIEAFKVEAGCGSGAAAVHLGYLAVASGMYDRVAVVGVEKMTGRDPQAVTDALAAGGDGDHEAAHGITFDALNALLMRRYMHEFDLMEEDFAYFPINAHLNAQNNPYAMFHRPISREAYSRARRIADPIGVLDSAPTADGAAAVILCSTGNLNRNRPRAVRVAASSAATDTVAPFSRRDPLWLEAIALSCRQAYAAAQVHPEDIDLFELHDASAILAPMSLEAAGLLPRGTGVYAAREGAIGIQGRIPISTMGGLKARGHPGGATGVYQIVECVEQLRGEAGANQVPGARVAMAQSVGGMAATAITHILSQ